MTPKTLAILKKSYDLGKAGIQYLERDNKVMLGMDKPQHIAFESDKIGRGNFDNGFLGILSFPGGDQVRFFSRRIPVASGIWNGPDLIKNAVKDGRLEASFWHDLICFFAKDIAKEWGVSEDDVLTWGHGLFHAAWNHYGAMYPKAKFVKTKARVAYKTILIGLPWYRRIKRLFGLSVVLMCFCAGCQGCSLLAPPPDITVTDSSGLFYDDVHSVEPWVSTNVIDGVAQ